MPEDKDTPEVRDAKQLYKYVAVYKKTHPDAALVFGLMTTDDKRFIKSGGPPAVRTSLATFLQVSAANEDIRRTTVEAMKSQSPLLPGGGPVPDAAVAEEIMRRTAGRNGRGN